MNYVLSLILLFAFAQVGGVAGFGGKAGVLGGASAGCTAGPTTNLVLQLDASTTTPGTITTWASGVGGITATKQGSGTISSVASVFGSQPGVRLTASNSQYFSLSSAINGGANVNQITVMVAFKPATVSSGAGQYFTGHSTSPSVQGTFAYWLANSGTVQGADNNYLVGLGQGTATFAANTAYQANVRYNFDTLVLSFRKNAATDTLSGSPTFSSLSQGIDVIGQDGNGTRYIDGWLGAIYIFNTDLTLADTQTWETYLTCKYGV